MELLSNQELLATLKKTRELTKEGIEKMILSTQGMKRMGLEFDVLLASSLKRAQQTAEIVKKYLPFKGKLETEELLCPGSSLQELLKKASRAKRKNVSCSWDMNLV